MTISPADEAFLDGFFSLPNLSWPDRSSEHASAAYLTRFLAALPMSGDVPLVLPRKDAGWHAAAAYVMCRTTSHAARLRPLLEAATAQNWCPFDGRLAQLNPSDPIDAAVLARFGVNTTYILRPPNPSLQQGLFAALRQLITSLELRPPRVARTARPIGRLLRDFETSLAAGQAATSLEILEEIERIGGVSHENIAFLRIRRLGQLGEDRQILSDVGLRTMVATEPPRLVREAILGAWYRVSASETNDPHELIELLREFPADIALLVEGAGIVNDADTWAAMAVVALARQDAELAHLLVHNSAEGLPQLRDALELIPGVALDRDTRTTYGAPDETTAVADTSEVRAPDASSRDSPPEGDPIASVAADTPVDSWAAWVQSLASDAGATLDIDAAHAWPAPGEEDEALADAIEQIPDNATGALFAGLGAFIDCDDHDRPSWRAAAVLIRRHLLSDSLTPSDLGAISALLAVFLRGGPDLSSYRSLLDDLIDDNFRGRWAAVSTAPAAMDIADLVVTSPTADRSVQQGFVAVAMQTLHAQRHRLPEVLRIIGDLATSDANLEWDWTLEEVSEPDATMVMQPRPRSILLYSLEEAVLARAQTAVDRLYPGMQVALSSAKVGSPSLREHARRADLIVLATRRASHAATGFIQAHAQHAHVEYADGCGSASLMRAIEQGLRSNDE